MYLIATNSQKFVYKNVNFYQQMHILMAEQYKHTGG